ncbi:MAG: hypothetical protein ACYSSI_12965 [Planctomycetota bacterium]|jgi:hypothetical protein
MAKFKKIKPCVNKICSYNDPSYVAHCKHFASMECSCGEMVSKAYNCLDYEDGGVMPDPEIIIESLRKRIIELEEKAQELKWNQMGKDL